MKNVVFLAPIDYVTGKLPFDAPSNGTSHGISARHNTKNEKGTIYNSLSKIGVRKSVPSADEIAQRTRFGAIGKLVGQRRKDPSKKATDAAAFKAQSTYKTFTKYLWSVCTATYNQSQTNS